MQLKSPHADDGEDKNRALKKKAAPIMMSQCVEPNAA